MERFQPQGLFRRVAVLRFQLDDYLALRRGLGYRSPSQERALRAFARYLDQAGHEGPIPAADVSPDGAHVATGGTDGELRVWDAATGRELFHLRAHPFTDYSRAGWSIWPKAV